MKVFILLSVIAVAFATHQCGENQHYNSCGTACPLTCENYDDPPVACVLMCNPGCHCDEGYVKTADGRCVRPEECPARAEQCGENQHYESCGTACPLTCENYDDPPFACVLMCNPGCHCDKGYVKTTDGRCVRPQECPARAEQVCGENERFSNCGSACPLTCDNYANPPRMCPAMCVMGCQCEKGFVKNQDGRCVRPEECPARTETEVCGENERFSNCGSACPLTCDNYANPPKICPLMCIIGCQCEKGFVQTQDGRCVRPEECPASAPSQKTCLDKSDPGQCRAYMPMWYYDVRSEKCHQFVYGGCHGNGNRYATEEECMQHCEGIRQRESSVNRCDLPAETGPCDAYFPRYYFDRTTGMCHRFVYGGCRGNENNFKTVEECNQACGIRQRESSVNRCDLPAETGPCYAAFRKYYFDRTTGQCHLFTYGGCLGNENNFETAEECSQACGIRLRESRVNRCDLPAEHRTCYAYMPRYYFDRKTGQCQRFIYSGCRGNENNFKTVEECNEACA